MPDVPALIQHRSKKYIQCLGREYIFPQTDKERHSKGQIKSDFTAQVDHMWQSENM